MHLKNQDKIVEKDTTKAFIYPCAMAVGGIQNSISARAWHFFVSAK
jgi:hypothetical protein